MTSGATTNSEILNNFLTLPGIAGFALMDAGRPAYFCNIDGTLMPIDEEQLTQNLTQIFESIPPEFIEIELHQSTYQTYLYRVDYSTVFMVLAHHTIEQEPYRITLQPLLTALRQSRVELFNQLHALCPDLGFNPDPPLNPDLDRPTSEQRVNQIAGSMPQINAIELETLLETLTVDPTVDGAIDPRLETIIEPLIQVSVSLPEIVAAFNALSTLAVGYLGKIIVSNQIKTTRPLDDWFLEIFTIDTQAQIAINLSQWNGHTQLTLDQYQLFQEWAYQLIRAIARVIRNFQDDVESQLSSEEKKLLLGKLGRS